MVITSRKLESNDWHYFTKWWRDKELIKLTSGDHTPLTDEDIKQRVAEMAMEDNSHHWLIRAEDVIVGHINLNKIDGNSAELQIVIGEKEYWGKGIGKEAISQTIKKANNLGFKKIIAEVRPENSRAFGLYKKMGFHKIDNKKYPDNPNLPEVIVMIKEL